MQIRPIWRLSLVLALAWAGVVYLLVQWNASNIQQEIPREALGDVHRQLDWSEALQRLARREGVHLVPSVAASRSEHAPREAWEEILGRLRPWHALGETVHWHRVGGQAREDELDDWEKRGVDRFRTALASSPQEILELHGEGEAARVRGLRAVRASAVPQQGPSGKPGELLGVISVKLPMEPYLKEARAEVAKQGWKALLLLVLGMLGIGILAWYRTRREREVLAAQRLLADRERRLHLAIQGAELGVWDMDLGSGRLEMNERWAEMFGYTREELRPLETAWQRLVHPEDKPWVDEVMRKHLEGETEAYVTEHRVRHRDGHYVWILDKARVVERAADGRALRISGTHLDISERKKLEEEDQDRKRFLRTVINAIPESVMVIQEDYKILLANRHSANGAGGVNGGVEGRYCYTVSHSRETPCHEAGEHCPLQEVMTSGETATARHSHLDSEGRNRIVEVIAAPIRDADGRIRQVIESARDITGRVEAEESALRMEQKLRQSQKMESLGILAGGIAHDFNNLLMAILGNTELAIERAAHGEEAVSFLNQVMEATVRASALTNAMLAYSGRGQFLLEVIDLRDLVRGMQGILRGSLPKSLDFQMELEPVAPIEADTGQLQQIVMNLILNASEASVDSGGSVTIRTRSVHCTARHLVGNLVRREHPDYWVDPGPYVCLEVEDNGVGMTPEVQERLFDPFFTTKFAGRGLGMAAVLGIVYGHKGVLLVDSNPGKGTRFQVFFPVTKRQPNDPTPKRSERSDPLSGRVLVVDDESALRDLARVSLEKAGLEVLSAEDGWEALEVFRRSQGAIDVVILDLSMPRLGGIETLAELRRLDEDVRVILVSGFSPEEAMRHAGEDRPTDFLQKPYAAGELLSKIRELLRRGEAEPQDVD